LRSDGNVITDRQAIADNLNNQFSSVFIEDNDIIHPQMSQLTATVCEGVDLNMLSPLFIEKLLSKLNPNKSLGPDGVHPSILKGCASTLAKPLSLIYKKSLATSELPSQWKTANITP